MPARSGHSRPCVIDHAPARAEPPRRKRQHTTARSTAQMSWPQPVARSQLRRLRAVASTHCRSTRSVRSHRQQSGREARPVQVAEPCPVGPCMTTTAASLSPCTAARPMFPCRCGARTAKPNINSAEGSVNAAKAVRAPRQPLRNKPIAKPILLLASPGRNWQTASNGAKWASSSQLRRWTNSSRR